MALHPATEADPGPGSCRERDSKGVSESIIRKRHVYTCIQYMTFVHVRVNKRLRRKEERSKQGHTKQQGKATRHIQ